MSCRIALAGNPNSGKTVIFNALAGTREKIGNWPGTTVERKEGRLPSTEREIILIDTPGTYSLTPYSMDERITRDFLLKGNPDGVVVVADASNLERNLYLAIQLLEMGLNVIVDLNMMDVARKRGIQINVGELREILQVPVVETVAVRGEGIGELRAAILEHAMRRKPSSWRMDYGVLETIVSGFETFLAAGNFNLALPPRALALRVLENDGGILEALKQTHDFRAVREEMIRLEGQGGGDLETALIEKRHAYLKGLVKECSIRDLTTEERLTLTDKIDQVVTNKFLGLPIFFGLMYGLFALVFRLGAPLVGFVNVFFAFLAKAAQNGILGAGLPPWFASLIAEGVISGVGSVLVFLPYILFLFLGISFLEDTGYLARAAFIMDRFMHALGLHGKSFIPMLLGFGCNVPGIMAARTLGSEKDRILTILILPLMSCAARLPVYTLFAGALFPRHQGTVVFSLYLLGIVLAVLAAKVFKNLLFRAETIPLVMELPPYRLPHFKYLLQQMGFKAWLFFKKAGTIIFGAAVIAWLLASLPAGVEYASEQSVIGRIGTFLAPVLAPAGFGFWQAAVALILGMVAKEIVVGTFGTLYGVSDAGLSAVLREQFSPLSGYAFLVMILIYMPCIATVATIRQETNWKWAALAVAYTLGLGWGLSTLVYQVGSLFLA